MSTFTEVELYRSTSDLINKTRNQCVIDADLLYTGALETFVDSTVNSDTVYYYKIFAVYVDGGITVDSTGQSVQTTTFADAPILLRATVELI